jgi:hypothetical protein
MSQQRNCAEVLKLVTSFKTNFYNLRIVSLKQYRFAVYGPHEFKHTLLFLLKQLAFNSLLIPATHFPPFHLQIYTLCSWSSKAAEVLEYALVFLNKSID